MTNQEKNDRFITVKGTGKVVAKPDLTIISFTLVQQTTEYEKTMELATNEIELLRKALISIGYDRKS
ncbi:MAG: SIMPL domain-containing protein, partial [Candidatus Methanoplasma sp.]|nr:SIMPL domain-containing protein [Candidatus Methanoplasma sp.]